MRKQTGRRNRGWLSAIGNRLSVVAGVALAAGMMLAGTARAAATDYYVATNGVDTNPGTINALAVAPAGTPKADTWEIYIAPTWKWLSAKYSYSVKSDTFGVKDSKGTSYLDISANYPIPDTPFTLIAHWGWQKYKGTSPLNTTNTAGTVRQSNDTLFSYKDIKIGGSYALPKDFTLGMYYTKAYSYNNAGYGGISDVLTGLAQATGTFPNNLGKGTATVYIQKTF